MLVETAKKLGLKCHDRGTTVTIEGPRFSSKAESVMFRGWGCDVVNMTTVPEVCLAKEAGICYASIGLPTDYDSWKDEPVSKYIALYPDTIVQLVWIHGDLNSCSFISNQIVKGSTTDLNASDAWG